MAGTALANRRPDSRGWPCPGAEAASRARQGLPGAVAVRQKHSSFAPSHRRPPTARAGNSGWRLRRQWCVSAPAATTRRAVQAGRLLATTAAGSLAAAAGSPVRAGAAEAVPTGAVVGAARPAAAAAGAAEDFEFLPLGPFPPGERAPLFDPLQKFT